MSLDTTISLSQRLNSASLLMKEASAVLGLSKKETKQYSLFRAIAALRAGAVNRQAYDCFEMECSRAIAKQIEREQVGLFVPMEVLQRPLGEAAVRAMQSSPGSKGGYLINVQQLGFIDILRARSVAMQMGARVVTDLTDSIVAPRQLTKATVTWQAGDGTSVTASEQQLGQLSLTPKTCVAITDISEQLSRQGPTAEQFVMADLANCVAIDGVDNAVINGKGGAQPLGILNTPGITINQDASAITYAKALAFVSAAASNSAVRGNPGFVTNTTGAQVCMQRQRFSGTDSPIWTGNMLDGQLVGLNAMSSEQIASGNLIFGSWEEVVIGEWGVLELAIDGSGTRFNTAQLGIRALWMVDVMIRYPQSFIASTNLS